MKIGVSSALAVASLVLVWAPVAAQHEGHTTAAPSSDVNREQVSACVESQQQVIALVDAASRRLETARQTNEAAAMRSAVDDLQAALSTMRSQLASCVQLAAVSGAATDATHAGHAMPAPAGDLIKDPRCAADVDPSTAPQASHEGRTYYFCSESDRQRFAAGPADYLQEAAGNLVITFRTVPSPPRGAAENQFEVTVRERQGKPVDGADVSVVLFMPAMPAMKMPEMRNEVKLKPAGSGKYTGAGQVMMAGVWAATVTVEHGGREIGQQQISLTAK